ncbi:MAG: sigma-54-dependent Fis family transcriptional regulator, partial [Deltaproteobacteria bacterium]
MPKARILVVDDEVGMLEVYSDTLHILDDVRVFTESNSQKAALRLETEPFDLLLTDIRMPGMTGVELLRHGREFDPELPVLMITAFPSVETAVEAMKLGAVDYITKPFMPDNLLVTVRRLLDERKLRQENRLLRRQVERSFDFEEIIGVSPAMQSVFATIERIAPSDADVLILGETGTGKELVARSIHRRSQR